MKVNITAKKMTLSQSFAEYANKKLSSKLDRFFGEEAGAKIVMSSMKDTVTLEVTVKYNNLLFRAEQTATDKNDALDACIDRIIRQIRKNKTKVQNQLRDTSFVGYEDVADEQKEFDIIKRKSFVLRPMSVDEAVLQMNMLGHTFFMFKNAESGDTNVVYKRDDGNYALLEPTKN